MYENAKINFKIAEEIRASLRNRGSTQQQLAKKYGIGRSQVSRIWRGKCWRKRDES